MTQASLIWVLAAALALMILAGLFVLHQNPLFEIYLSSWGIC